MELKPFHFTNQEFFHNSKSLTPPKRVAVKRKDKADFSINPFHANTRMYFDRSFFMALIALFLLSAVVASGVLREFSSNSLFLGAKRYAFIQVRAITETGTAIPGAEVIIDGKINGYTDSFGYWQRYMRVQLGGKIEVHLNKNYQNQTVSGIGILDVKKNLPENQELEFKTSVVLKSKTLAARKTNKSDALATEM